MTDKDYMIFETIVKNTQSGLLHLMNHFLRKHYKKVITTKDYVLAFGDVPIAVVAHLDTVFETPVKELYYDRQKKVFWSPNGLGADDRAGVFAIIKLVQNGLRPCVILATDEEKGGVGAIQLAADYPECPFGELKYMIELDRHGKDDCVFYHCYCESFMSYVESFGFKEQYGSFSDISFLMSEWGICGVNLSTGYYNEHSRTEYLNYAQLSTTIDKVSSMLTQENIAELNFEYGESTSPFTFEDKCERCGRDVWMYELLPVETFSGDRKHYCAECAARYAVFCHTCGTLYESNEPNDTNFECPICKEDI